MERRKEKEKETDDGEELHLEDRLRFQ